MEKTRTSWAIKVLYVILSLLLICFILMPVINVILYGINTNQIPDISQGEIKKGFFFLKKSLTVSLTVTFLSTLAGFIAAFTLTRIRFRGRKVLRILMLTPLINPPFVGSIAFIMLFGKRGLITNKLLGLSSSPFGLKGIIVMQTLGLISFAYILISSSIEKVNPQLEEAARNMGADEFKIFRTITLNTMLPEITSTALLVFLSSMADFSTPIVIGGSYQTLASQLYLEITGLYNMRSASILGLFLLMPCLLAFILQRYVVSKKSYFVDRISGDDIEYKGISSFAKSLAIILTSMFIFIVCFQYIFIVIGAFTKQWGYDYHMTLGNFQGIFKNDFRPFINSIKLAVVSSFLASFMGVFLSYIIYRKKLKLSPLVDFVATLPAAVPGILFGIAYLVSFKKPPLVLLGTSIVIYIICVFRFLNVGLRSGYALLSHVDPNIELASFNLGMGELGTFIRISMPILKPAFINSFIKCISTGMVTLGSIILLMIPRNKVAVQMIFQIISSSNIEAAASMALILSFTSLSLIGFFYLLFNIKRFMYKRSNSI